MEAKELMIGDWYYDQSLNKPRRWHQLQFAEEFGTLTYMRLCQPIPLTEETLKANGFIGNILSAKENVIRVFMLGSDYPMYIEGDYSYSLPAPKYVHELQHALRLCGLNELADNFKVTP